MDIPLLKRLYTLLSESLDAIYIIILGTVIFYRFALAAYLGGYIFDEVYYVNAARDLLSGIGTNHEHPPLVKLIIAAAIYIFGDRPLSWRIPSFIAYIASLYLVFYILYRLNRNFIYSLSIMLILALDLHYFNLMSIAMLDPICIALSLSTLYLLIERRNIVYPSILYGLALLSKLQAIILVIPYILITYLWYSTDRRLIRKLADILIFLAISAGIFLIFLDIYDVIYTQFSSFVDHLKYMFSYHSALTYENESEIIPVYKWISTICYEPIPYYIVSMDSRILIRIVGIATPLSISLIPIAILTIYTGFKYRDKIGLSCILGSMLYLLFYLYLEYMQHRYVYPFYIIYILPLIIIGLNSTKMLNPRYFKILITILLITQAIVFLIYLPNPLFQV